MKTYKSLASVIAEVRAAKSDMDHNYRNLQGSIYDAIKLNRVGTGPAAVKTSNGGPVELPVDAKTADVLSAVGREDPKDHKQIAVTRRVAAEIRNKIID
jgi:ribosome-interacting GTPase 1